LNASTGTLGAFLDQDDVWEKEKLALRVIAIPLVASLSFRACF
jgi:hypothetical protein